MPTGSHKFRICTRLAAMGRRLAGDESGNIVLIFAVLMVPMLALSIGALDYGRSNGARHELQTAIDAGLSFAANRIGEDDRDIEETFRRSFTANLPANLRQTLATFRFDRQAMRMEASAEVSVPVHVVGIFKGNRVVVEASGSLSVAPRSMNTDQIARQDPQVARQIEDAKAQIDTAKAQIRAVLGRDLDLEALRLPQGTEQIDREEAERIAREIMRRLGH